MKRLTRLLALGTLTIFACENPAEPDGGAMVALSFERGPYVSQLRQAAPITSAVARLTPNGGSVQADTINGSGPFQFTFGNLPVGAYSVTIEGISADGVEQYGVGSGTVREDETVVDTVAVNDFFPDSVVSLNGSAVQYGADVRFRAVPNATGYTITVGSDSAPAGGTQIPVSGGGSQGSILTETVTVQDTGRFHVSLRANNQHGSAGPWLYAGSRQVVADAFAPDSASSQTIGFGTGMDGNVVTGAELDWFRFEACVLDTVMVQTRTATAATPSSLVEALDLVTLDSVVGSANGPDASIGYVVESSGTYYVRVGSLDGSAGHYELTVNLTAGAFNQGAPSCSDLPADPGETVHTISTTNAGVNSTVTIDVQARDQFGNDAVAGGETVDIIVTGANADSIRATDPGDGTYQASYTAANIGTDIVTTKLGGTEIGDSPDTVTVTGPETLNWASATSGNWDDPAMWDKNRVPTVVDTVIIDVSGTYQVTARSDISVERLVLGDGAGSGLQTLQVTDSSTLLVANGQSLTVDVGGWLGTSPGTDFEIEAGASVQVFGEMGLDQGNINNLDTLFVQPGGAFHWTGGVMTGSGVLALYGDLHFNANGTFTGGQTVWIPDGGNLNMSAGDMLLDNAQVVADSGSGISVFGAARTVMSEANGGAVTVNGNMNVAQGAGVQFEFFAPITQGTTGDLQVPDAVVRLSGPSNWGGTGYIGQGDAIIFGNGEMHSVGGSMSVAGDYVVESGATLDVTGTVIHEGTSVPQIHGTLVINGYWQHDPFALVTGNGTIDVTSADSVRFNGFVSPGLPGGVGTLTWNGPWAPTPGQPPQCTGVCLPRIHIHLQDTAAGGHDVFQINGAASLDGFLNLLLLGTPPFVRGQEFTVVTYVNSTGSNQINAVPIDVNDQLIGQINATDIKAVVGTRADAGMSTAAVPASVLVNDSVPVTIDLHNETGDPLTAGGDQVEVLVTGFNPDSIAAVDNGDGTYEAWYTAITGGTDEVTVRVNGDTLAQSPDTVTVSLPTPERVSWLGGAGNWTDPLMWDKGRVPTTLDTAVIDSNGTYVVDVVADVSVGILELGGSTGEQKLRVDAGYTLTVPAGNSIAVADSGFLEFATGSRFVVENGGGAPAVAVSGELAMSGAVIENADSIHIMPGAAMHWFSDSLSGAGVLRLDGTLHYNDSGTVAGGQTISVGGTGVLLLNQRYLHLDGSTLAVDSGGVVTVQNAGRTAITSSGGAGFTNAGRITTSLATVLDSAVLDIAITQTGTGVLQAFQGTTVLPQASTLGGKILIDPNQLIVFDGGVTHTVTDSLFTGATYHVTSGTTLDVTGFLDHQVGSTAQIDGTLNVTGDLNHVNGATLIGVGTVDVSSANSVTLDGAVEPGLAEGTLSWIGDFLMTSTSVLIVEIADTASGQFDVLSVTNGNVGLNGTLQVSFLNSFVPVRNDSFTVVVADSVFGSFFTYNGTAVAPEMALGADVTNTELYLVTRPRVRLSPDNVTTNWTCVDDACANPGPPIPMAAIDENGDSIPNGQVAWSVLNPNFGSVDANGNVTPSESGALTVVATANGASGYGLVTSETLGRDADEFTWTELAFDGLPSQLLGVWAADGSDFFLVGGNQVFRYDGAAITDITPAGGSAMQDVWGFGPNDVYVLSTSSGGTLWYYDGATWTSTGPFAGANSVWGVSPRDIYLTASGGIIYHYDAVTDVITSVQTPVTTTLNDLWGTGSLDVIAVGDDGEALQFDGISNWFQMTTPAGPGDDLRGIYGFAGNDIVAVGETNSGGPLALRYDGSTWTSETASGGAARTAVWGTGRNDYLAVGEDGDIDRRNDGSWSLNSNGLVFGRIDDLHGTTSQVGTDGAYVGVGFHYGGGARVVRSRSNQKDGVWHFRINGIRQRNTVVAGSSVPVTTAYRLWTDNPGVNKQIVLGIGSDAQTCVFDGAPGVYPGTSSGAAGASLMAPTVPGTYTIFAGAWEAADCATAQTQYESTPPTHQPVGILDVIPPPPLAAWPMNEASGLTVSDTVSIHDGTLGQSDMSGQPTRILGALGRGLQFDGGEVMRVSGADVDSFRVSSVTIEAYVRGFGPGLGDYAVAFVDSSLGNPAYALMAGIPGVHLDNGLVLTVSPQTGSCPGSCNYSQQIPSGSLWDGNWHHVAGVADGDSLRIYLDGVQSGVAHGGTLSYNGADLVTLGSFNGAQNHIEADIDEVVITEGVVDPSVFAAKAALLSAAPRTVIDPPSTTTLANVGDTVHLSAHGLDATGAMVTGLPVTWTGGDTTIVTVDSNGVAQARSPGTGMVFATIYGTTLDTISITVTAPQWTWLKGDSAWGETANYGAFQVEDPNNVPGGRQQSISWYDNSGQLWLFGGLGASGAGILNDLWVFDTTSGNWTWRGGQQTADVRGIYGTLRQPGGYPGGRYEAAMAQDASGDVWMFGGEGCPATGPCFRLNDLWRWDGSQWTWMAGPTTTNDSTYGVFSQDSTAMPGVRNRAVMWVDAGGDVWVFGGYGRARPGDPGYDGSGSGTLNDLWRFDTTTFVWSWEGGDSLVGQAGVYTSFQVPNATNKPGARQNAVAWTIGNDLWLFGGWGRDGSGVSEAELNDLWRWDGSQWAWMSGSQTMQQTGTYGTIGVEAPSNAAGARRSAAGWVDVNGNLMLLGGIGYHSTGQAYLNDVWRFNPTTLQWTWLEGLDAGFTTGTYGVQNAPDPANEIGARHEHSVWYDASGDVLWVFGGYGYGHTSSSPGPIGDLWRWRR